MCGTSSEELLRRHLDMQLSLELRKERLTGPCIFWSYQHINDLWSIFLFTGWDAALFMNVP